jgi:hypothetical protein
VCLVTTSLKEKAPARGKDEHVVVLSSRRGGEDEDELLVLIFHEEVRGLRRAVLDWVVLGCWWAMMVGCCGQVRSR